MKTIKIKSIKYYGRQRALNISMKKNKNFMLGNGILTHNTRIAQDALRNVMETYSKNCFFILTCNNINKIEEPIKSRCVLISFAYPDKGEVKTFLEYICQKEDMVYDDEGLKTLIEQNYPSIRNCVLALQDLYVQGLAINKENVKPVNEMFDTLWNFLKEKRWLDIKTVVLQSTVDPRELNTYFWQKFVNEQNIKGIQVTCRNERDFASGADPKVIFVTSIIEMVK